MLQYDLALVEARQHLFSLAPPVGWVWKLNHGQRMDDGWFFWYQLESLRFDPDDSGSRFGYAPGFAILDDASVRPIGWSQLPDNLSPVSYTHLTLPTTPYV